MEIRPEIITMNIFEREGWYEHKVTELEIEITRLRTELDAANVLLGKTGYMCPKCNNPVSSADKGCVYCELETERMRLAACGVAALGYFDGCKDEYRSASLEDVLRLYASMKEAKKGREKLREAGYSYWRLFTVRRIDAFEGSQGAIPFITLPKSLIGKTVKVTIEEQL